MSRTSSTPSDVVDRAFIGYALADPRNLSDYTEHWGAPVAAPDAPPSALGYRLWRYLRGFVAGPGAPGFNAAHDEFRYLVNANPKGWHTWPDQPRGGSGLPLKGKTLKTKDWDWIYILGPDAILNIYAGGRRASASGPQDWKHLRQFTLVARFFLTGEEPEWPELDNGYGLTSNLPQDGRQGPEPHPEDGGQMEVPEAPVPEEPERYEQAGLPGMPMVLQPLSARRLTGGQLVGVWIRIPGRPKRQ